VLEAYATTGSGDVVCRLAAESNEDLQQVPLELNKSEAIRRSTSVMILSVIVAPRTLPLRATARRYQAGSRGEVRQTNQPAL